jgi:hypothetical protein
VVLMMNERFLSDLNCINRLPESAVPSSRIPALKYNEFCWDEKNAIFLLCAYIVKFHSKTMIARHRDHARITTHGP